MSVSAVRYRNGFLRMVALIAVALALASMGLTTYLWFQVTSEGKGRRDQTCMISERQHKQDVEGLSRTYRYLAELSRRERLAGINAAVLANLPAAERKAGAKPPNLDGRLVVDPAPLFCDEPGIGLPEPDPRLPKRPRELWP